MEELLNISLDRFIVIYQKALDLEKRHHANQSLSNGSYAGEKIYYINTEDLRINDEILQLYDQLDFMRLSLSSHDDVDNQLYNELVGIFSNCTGTHYPDKMNMDPIGFLDEITTQSISESFYPMVFQKIKDLDLL